MYFHKKIRRNYTPPVANGGRDGDYPLSFSFERSGNEDELAGFCLRWSWNLDPSPPEAAQDDIHWIR